MNSEIEKLIDLALADGQLTDKERIVILKKAAELGVDADEVEMTLDGRLHQMQATQTKSIKEKVGNLNTCPSCGSSVNSFQTKCSDCGHEFRNIKINNSINELLNKLKKISKSQFKDGNGDLDKDQYFEARAEIIKDFAIPTTKEDLVEFATKSVSEFNSNEIENNQLNEAWESKAVEALSKLQVFAYTDKSITVIYDNIEKTFKKKIEQNKKKKRNSFLEMLIMIPLSIGISYLMITFILSFFGFKYWPF